ncbi:hypothetical protein [Paeniglutamicibacter sulfureus]|uniref:Uncharacterized protein n=2 Tax=Paeniglutamicibacter sulfureus TaxID=43666 RepID=A0ABU2BJX6_9MICC|nr:hypothetical protein [Paeniglutamicibacter sulfureus]MDR7358923.1 hypothetical protein [Paeniglutamicibacter sulfureus]
MVRSIVVGLCTVIPGMIMLWIASSLDSGVWATFWSGISTTVISAGILGVLYEAFLKRALVRDIQQGSQIDYRLLNAGITDATLDPDSVSLKEIFGASNKLDIVPSHPLTWHDNNFTWLIRLVQERQITCRIYLPEPIKYGRLLEAVVDGDPQLATAEHCSAKFNQYMQYWESQDANSNNSTLEVFYYGGYPQSGFIVSDTSAVIYASPPKGNSAINNIAYIYRSKAAKATIGWLQSAIRQLNAAPVAGTQPDQRTPEQILPLSTPNLPTEIQREDVTAVETEGT